MGSVKVHPVGECGNSRLVTMILEASSNAGRLRVLPEAVIGIAVENGGWPIPCFTANERRGEGRECLMIRFRPEPCSTPSSPAIPSNGGTSPLQFGTSMNRHAVTG